MANLNDPSLTTVGTHRAAAYQGMQEDYWSKFDQWMDDPESSPAPSILARKGGRRIKGRKTVALAKTSRPQSATAAGEGYTAVPPGTSGYINPEITPKKMLAQLGNTLEVRADARSGQSSWITATEEDMKGLEEQILQNYIHNIYFGRFNVLGRVASVSGTTITLQPRTNQAMVAAAFWDQGLLGNYGLAVGKSIGFIVAANGAGGSPVNHTTTAIGDPANATSALAAGRRYITAVDNSNPAAPTITVDTDCSAQIAAGTFIIEYNSRRYAMDSDADDAIYDQHSMEGVGSAFTSSSIVAAHLGLLKASYAGLRPQHIGNSGVLRQWSDRYAKFILRTAIRECGRAPTNLLCTLAQMDEVEKEYANLRRFEPVQGKQGADYTTMGIVAHGYLLKYTPDWMALPNTVIQTDPSFGEYLENFPLGPAVAGYERYPVQSTDQERIVLARRGNILYSNPMGLGLISDNIEAEFTAP